MTIGSGVKTIGDFAFGWNRSLTDVRIGSSVTTIGNYAIHGTDQIKRLGKPASHGCVRLHPDNAKILFQMVKAEGMENTRVVIVQ